MLKKFRLERTSAYERLVIAQRLAQMLEWFIEGIPGPVEVGSEQGGIPNWDDIVVRHETDVLEHIQVKRQATPFCTARSLRGADARAPSALDKAFVSLADWSLPSADNDLATRRFVLEFASLGVDIKKDLTVAHLEQLCNACKGAGATAAGLSARMAQDTPTKRAYEWLTSWAGFQDWEHIRRALSRLTVKISGLEADLEGRVHESLARHFTDTVGAREALLAYIGREATDVSSITCPPLMRHLYPFARPDLVTWTQYRSDRASTGWVISGTHGINDAQIEGASLVVDALWRADGAQRKLRIAAECPQQDPASPSLAAAILRLALHLQGGSQGILANEPGWRARAKHDLGHTLGIGESDLDNLAWVGDTQKLASSAERALEGIVPSREEATRLASAMDDAVWKLVVEKVHDRLQNVGDPSLLQAMETMWIAWRNALDQAPDVRSILLAQLFYPVGEGRNAKHLLRVGPLTVDLLATALETMLLVAVAVGGNDSSWDEFTQCGAVTTIALKRWSGPSGTPAGVREILSDGLSGLLGPGTSPVVVLSGVEVPAAFVLSEGLADDASVSTSMGSPRAPHLLVTRWRIQRQLLHEDLETVKSFFREQLRGHQEARQSAIQAFRDGA